MFLPVILVTMAMCLASASVPTLSNLPPPPGPPTKLLVPAYWFPGPSSPCSHPDYLRLAQGGQKVAAIVNPWNGPVSPDPSSGLYSAAFPSYHACFQTLFEAGNEVYGYVKTKEATETSPGVWLQTGLRNMVDIENDIRMWAQNFNLTGIFLDEVSNLWQVTEAVSWGDHVAFYQGIFNMVRTVKAGWRIVINPGSAFPHVFFSAAAPTPTADLAVVYEGSADRWDPTSISGGASSCPELLWTQAKGTFGPGPWCPLVPGWDGADSLIQAISNRTFGADKAAAALVYGGDGFTSSPATVVALGKSWGLSYVYLTDQSQAEPWKVLPSNWEALLAAV